MKMHMRFIWQSILDTNNIFFLYLFVFYYYTYVIAQYIGMKIPTDSQSRWRKNLCIFISVYIDKIVMAGIEQMFSFQFKNVLLFHSFFYEFRYTIRFSLKCTDIISK